MSERSPDAVTHVAGTGWPGTLRPLALAAAAASAALIPVAPAVSRGPARAAAGTAAAAGRTASPRRDCFGAAARDPAHHCATPPRTVVPTPDEAEITPNTPCIPPPPSAPFTGCAFGVPAAQAVETVALLGDSHGGQYRATLPVVARAKHWQVMEFARPHCPFTLAPLADPKILASCRLWNHMVLSWFAGHPEVRTVFVSVNAFVPVRARAGQTESAAKVTGSLRAMQALPASVQNIIVIRDDPQDRFDTHDCIRRAMARRARPDLVCAIARHGGWPLRADPEVGAAALLGPRRAHVVDFTRFYCDRRRCYPVVGGVLVHKDGDHLTTLFATTLGPYLLRQVDALERRLCPRGPAGRAGPGAGAPPRASCL